MTNVKDSQADLTSTKINGSFTDHLANERTFLAWTRTSLSIFAFGCAISRFGGGSNNHRTSLNSDMKSMVPGLTLIICGLITFCYSIYRYHRINQQILRADLTEISRTHEVLAVTLVLLLCIIVTLIVFVLF